MIDYGDRGRLGALIPSGNAVAEPELRAMLPPGLGLVVTRLELRGSSEAELLRMASGIEPAARLLADARPDAIAFHCTAVSTFAPALATEIRRRIEDATGLPALATADAILAALGALGARRVVLVTPYIEAVHAREIAFLEAGGFDLAGSSCLGVDGNAEMARIAPVAIAEQTRAAVAAASAAEVCLISCTAIRSGVLIAALEAEIGMPVVTSNTAMAWHVARTLGLRDGVQGFGRLLAQR